MSEEELLQIGFFEIEPILTEDKSGDVKCFKLFEYYKGVFVRLIVSKYQGAFEVIHLYFDSPKSDELKMEFFGTDLSLENIIDKIKQYRASAPPSDDGPETF